MLPHRRASGAADLTAYIYLLRWDTRLVVSDVDGTITRSDLLGHVLPTLGVDWSHPGITQLFHNIDSNGYQIMFLSSRCGGAGCGHMERRVMCSQH
jgi:phosphatidate phosphatase LPIN